VSTNEKKYILNLCLKDLPKDLMDICEKLELSISSTVEEGGCCHFQFIDNEETSLNVDAPVLFIGSVSSKIEFFKNNGKAIIEEGQFSNPLYQVVIERLLGGNSTLAIDKAYSEVISSAGQFKITDHLNSGYYCDLLAAHASVAEFNYLNIRNGFFNLLNFISVVIDNDSASFPLEVDFGTSNESFILQAHFNIEEFGAEYLWKSFEDNHDYGFLNQMIEYVDGLDTYILEKTGRLVLTLFWNKEESEGAAPIFIHNIKSFKMINIEEVVSRVAVDPLDHVNGLKKAKAATKAITEVRNLLSGDEASDGHLVAISRVTKYLKNILNESDVLSLENIESYLLQYPNQDLIKILSVNDKKLIVDSIHNKQTFENISNSLEEVAQTVGFDDFLESLISKVDNLSLEQANEIVTLAGSKQVDANTRLNGWLDSSDDKTIVSGSKEEQLPDHQLVKGQKEDSTEESFIVKGSAEDLSDGVLKVRGGQDSSADDDKLFTKISSHEVSSKWSDTKSDLANEIRERIKKSDTKDISKLSEEVSQIVSGKLNIDEEESQQLVKGLFENAAEQFVTNKDIGPGNGSEVVRNRLENEKLQGDVTRKDGQLVRMKRLIDSMKNELVNSRISAQESKDIVPSSESTEMMQEISSEAELSQLHAELERRSKKIELLEDNLKNVQKNTTNGKSENETIIVASTSAELDDPTLVAKNIEIKKLEAKVTMTFDRIEQLNENLKAERESSNSRSESETKHFREKIMKSQELISGFQTDKKALVKKLEELKKENELLASKVDAESTSSQPDEIDKKNQEISDLAKLIKAGDDKYRTSNLRVKQLEQKNKFLTAQVNQETKSASKSKGAGASGGNDAKFAHKIKQLDKMNEKLKEGALKSGHELTAKKKELLLAKQEKNTLSLKVGELERKLTKYEKKAA